MIDIDYCLESHAKLKKHLTATPLTFSESYSKLFNREIYLKLDNKFVTGSFKERGALNFLLNLTTAQKKRGVCAASAGNHALALSYHARKMGVNCNIVMPVHAPLVKMKACQDNKAQVLSTGETFADAQVFAKELCAKEKYTYAPAFDHDDVIAGQASCALEILNQLKEFDSIVVPVGGGGLISGIATVLKARNPKTYILGVQSEWAAAEQKKSKYSAMTPLRPISIADGIAVKKIGELTSKIISKRVDDLIAVSENELSDSLVEFLQVEKTLIEGAAASALAGLHKNTLPKRCKKTVVIISGGNIDTSLLLRLIERNMAEHDRVFRMRLSIPDRPGSLNALTGILAREAANILQVQHDRSFPRTPGNVEVTLLLEVKDADHRFHVMKAIEEQGIEGMRI